MFLMGMVYFEESTNSYVAVGEAEFHEEIRRRSMAKNMKEVRRAMLNTLVDGSTSGSIPLSNNLVKVVTLLAMQPSASGMHVDEVAFHVVEAKCACRGFFAYKPIFLAVHAVFPFIIGFAAGFYAKKLI